MIDVTAMAAAITTVVLNPFCGGETEDFQSFKEHIRSSVSLAQVPNNGKLDYLKLHLTGGALAFFLEIPTADRQI